MYKKKWTLDFKPIFNKIIINMWKTYKQVAIDSFPNIIVAVDSFHVIKHLNMAIDYISLKIMKKCYKSHSKIRTSWNVLFYFKKV